MIADSCGQFGGARTLFAGTSVLERLAHSEAEWAAFVDMVRGGAPSLVDIDDGRAPLVIGLAAWRSIREQRPVRIEEITA